MNNVVPHAIVALATLGLATLANAAPPEQAAGIARIEVIGKLPLRVACPSVDDAAFADALAPAWDEADKPSTVAVSFRVQGTRVFDVRPATGSLRNFHQIRRAVHQLACDGGDDGPHGVRFVIRFVDGDSGAPVLALRDEPGAR